MGKRTAAVVLALVRDRHGAGERGVDRDMKLFFAPTSAIFDAGIVAWDNKRVFDGADWFPYQPTTFPTPPFAEYISGHSTFSAAGVEILERFTGSDFFGAAVTIPAGSSKVEPGAVPAAELTLSSRQTSMREPRDDRSAARHGPRRCATSMGRRALTAGRGARWRSHPTTAALSRIASRSIG